MSDDTARNNLKIIAIAAIIWNAYGVVMFFMSMQMPVEILIETYGKEGAGVLLDRPRWTNSAYAAATIGGLIGSVGLLIRKRWSSIMFLISFIGIVATDIWSLASGMVAFEGLFAKVLMILVFVIAAFLLWYSHQKTKQGILT